MVRARRTKGFTLLELLVSMAIVGIVLLGLTAAARLSISVAERGPDATDRRLRVEAARLALRSWVESAWIDADGEYGFEGRENPVGSGDAISFVSLQTWPLGYDAGEPIRMSVRIAEDSGLVADHGPVETDDPPGTVVLLPDASRLRARYLIELGGERRWLGGWSSRVQLPIAIELQFDVGDGGPNGNRLQTMTIALGRRG